MSSESTTTAPSTGTPSVAVVIPVFNEEETLEELLQRLHALPFAVQPIFVDNGSTDRSVEILRDARGVQLIEHGENLGYGASLIDGMKAATAELVVIIDADLEFPPEEIPLVVKALESHDVVYASRFLGRSTAEVGMPLFRNIGNRMVSLIFNVLYAQKVTDLYTGFKGMRRDILGSLRLEHMGFEHVMEFAARLARSGHRIVEVPIRYQLRRAGRSNMRHVSETLKFLWLVAKCRVDRNTAGTHTPRG